MEMGGLSYSDYRRSERHIFLFSLLHHWRLSISYSTLSFSFYIFHLEFSVLHLLFPLNQTAMPLIPPTPSDS